MNEPEDDGRLIELAALSPDDPRRAEAAKDPRVRAWFLEHDAFLAPGLLLPENERDVTRAAEAAIARARLEVARGSGIVLELPRPARSRRPGLPRWALAAAGVAIVAGAAVVAPRFTARESGNLRTLSPESNVTPFASLPASRDAEGRLVLTWQRADGATSYRVEILNGLDTVGNYDVTNGESLALDPASLPAGESLLWRVLAMRDGETIATTPPRTLPR